MNTVPPFQRTPPGNAPSFPGANANVVHPAPAEARPVRVSPSIRLPVTPGNRELLRRLRAEELRRWNHASSHHQPSKDRPNRPRPSIGSHPPDLTDTITLGFMMVVGLGAILQSEQALRGLITQWQAFSDFVLRSIG